MHLQVCSPSEIVLDTNIEKFIFEGLEGEYSILPHHQDFVSVVKTGIVRYFCDSKNFYIACQQGTVIKKMNTLILSTPLAILGDDLNKLIQKIEDDFKQMEENRKEQNISMARLEIGLTRGLLDLVKKEEF